MADGIDKLILLSDSITEDFLSLARGEGSPKYGYKHVIDLRESRHELPVVLYCDGRRNGIHKLDIVGVANLGLQGTLRVLRPILGRLSLARIYRIDLCADIAGICVWDLAEIAIVSRTQNFQIHNTRGGASLYLRNSADKTILIYDKAKQFAAKGNSLATVLGPNEPLTRIEVQLKGRGVPFRKIHDLYRYADLDLVEGLKLLELRPLRHDAKPLHLLAAGRLRHLIHRYGLQGTKKRFSPSHWAYIEKALFCTLEGPRLPDLRHRLKRSIQNWLQNRIRFPRLKLNREDHSDESD